MKINLVSTPQIAFQRLHAHPSVRCWQPTLAQRLFGQWRRRWHNVGKPPVKKFHSMYSINQSDCSMVLCGHCLTEGKR